MNERIKKLARECFDVANDGNEDEYLGTTAGVEKFAQLIVWDCVEIIEMHRIPIRPSPSGELRECRDKIKKHFGVEP